MLPTSFRIALAKVMFVKAQCQSPTTTEAVPGPTHNTNQTVIQPSSVEHHSEPFKDPANLEHFKKEAHTVQPEGKTINGNWTLPHPIWSDEEVQSVSITHKEPGGMSDKFAYGCVWVMRQGFDTFSGFRFGERTEKKWLTRIVFLETVAGVPGMVAGMLRHMRSLRRMQRDWGWIHTLLEEAENERMHLMTAIQLKQPSWAFRMCVIGAQGIFFNAFFVGYLCSPRFCHRFVGYLEEEAVKTYTKCIDDIDNGPLAHWQTQPALEIARTYWKLEKDATMRDVFLAIRADEAHHRLVNHNFADLEPDELNPFEPGK